MRFSFTQKVFTAILGMIVLILGGVLFFLNLQTKRIAESEISRRLEQANMAFQNYQDEIHGKLFTINYYTSSNSAFLAYMAEALDNNDAQSLLDQYEEIQNFSNCDFMIVTDVDGVPVVDTTGQIAAEASDQLQSFIEVIDQEGLPIAVLRAMGRLYTVVMSPIISGGYLHGYVAVGYRMEDATASDIGNVANCDILVLSESPAGQSKLVASYFEDGTQFYSDSELLAALAGVPENEMFDFTVRGNRHLGRMFQLEGLSGEVVGRWVTIKSFRKELEPFREINRGLLFIGLVAILIIAPLSILAAREVTRPVNHLVAAIGKVREGEYDEQRIKVESRDEIGIMAGAFKAMVKELREQKELIEFLEESAASKAEELDPDRTLPLTPSGPVRTVATVSESIRKTLAAGENLPSGFLLGNRYEILNVLGRGGMGVVYRARDKSLDEVVAIKMLHVDSEELADMLKRETKLARKVTHRNILRIYDLGELEGVQFISMEFVNGTTLKDLLKRVKRLPLPIGMRVIGQVCRGLEAAHEAGVIHGDIKPDNVIINARGEVKIMDFGVARIATLEAPGGGGISGTPAYMPPEQFRGHTVDPRSDIYSLGIMMYELFAGSLPYSGKTLMEFFKHHLNTHIPPLKAKNPEVPDSLVAIIERAARKKPAERFATTGDILKALQKVA